MMEKHEKESILWLRAFNRLATLYETAVVKPLMAAGLTWPGIMIWDDLRSLDYLCGRKDLDAGRIGTLGFSFGGLRSAFLGALDDRIKANVTAGWMCTSSSMLANYIRKHSWASFIPGMHNYLDFPDAASMNCPHPYLVINYKSDSKSLFPLQGMEDAAGKIEKVYEKAKAEDKFDSVFYNDMMQDRDKAAARAVKFFKEWL